MTPKSAKEREYTYRLYQDGFVVASVASKNKVEAIRDIQHYAFVYGQDGPVEIRSVIKGAVK